MIPILHRDERIVAVDKPGGLLVHRSDQAPDETALLQLVRDQVGAFVYPIHRLDRPASGIVLFALDKEAAAAAQKSLQDDATEKSYVALVRGATEESFESRRPLHNDAGREQKAWTEFRKITEIAGCSLLDVRLHTGRRHQIRRHLAHLAHHIIGDVRYGKGRINQRMRDDYCLPRLFLHARRLVLTHPTTKEPLRIDSPLPADLREFLDRLSHAPRPLVV